MQRDTVEFLEFTLTERDGKDISGDAVTVAIIPSSNALETATWLPATFLTATTDDKGKPATKWRTSSVVTWTTANYPESAYLIYAKVADSPEAPAARIGRIQIT